jgi:hypothetical protein
VRIEVAQGRADAATAADGPRELRCGSGARAAH